MRGGDYYAFFSDLEETDETDVVAIEASGLLPGLELHFFVLY